MAIIKHLNQLEEVDDQLKKVGKSNHLTKNQIKEEIKRRLALYPNASYFEIANHLMEDIQGKRWPVKFIK